MNRCEKRKPKKFTDNLGPKDGNWRVPCVAGRTLKNAKANASERAQECAKEVDFPVRSQIIVGKHLAATSNARNRNGQAANHSLQSAAVTPS